MVAFLPAACSEPTQTECIDARGEHLCGENTHTSGLWQCRRYGRWSDNACLPDANKKSEEQPSPYRRNWYIGRLASM